MSEKPEQPHENFDYEKWRQINEFANYLNRMHYMNQHKAIVDTMMENLMIIDEVVDHMDEYPEAEYIIKKIQRRNLNDKDF